MIKKVEPEYASPEDIKEFLLRSLHGVDEYTVDQVVAALLSNYDLTTK